MGLLLVARQGEAAGTALGVIVMTRRVPCSDRQRASLADVCRGKVEFDNSLGAGQGNGCRWAERIGGAVFDAQQDLRVQLRQTSPAAGQSKALKQAGVSFGDRQVVLLLSRVIRR